MEFILKLFELLFVRFAEIAAWPAAAVCIAYFFKTELRDFLSRTIEIGPQGAKAIPPRQQNPSPLDELTDGQSQKSLPSPSSDEVLVQVEKNILDSLRREGVANKTPAEQQAMFVREYSTLAIRAHYQSINFTIFGSQFAALLHLRDRQPKSRKALNPFFKNHEDRAKERSLEPKTFDDWVGFLLRAQLVEMQSDGRYVATAMGKQYIDSIAPAAGITVQTQIL